MEGYVGGVRVLIIAKRRYGRVLQVNFGTSIPTSRSVLLGSINP